MQFRFSIRDLLWLALVAALAVGWSVDHRRLTAWSELGGPGLIEAFPDPPGCFLNDPGKDEDAAREEPETALEVQATKTAQLLE